MKSGDILPICFSDAFWSGGSTVYGAAAGAGSEDAPAVYVMPRDGLLRNLHLKTSIAPGVGESVTFTVRKNGVDTGIVVAISGASQVGSDLTNAVSFLAGDVISVKGVATAGVSVITASGCIEAL